MFVRFVVAATYVDVLCNIIILLGGMKYLGVLASNYIQCKLSWKLFGNIPCGDMYEHEDVCVCVCLGWYIWGAWD